MLLKKNSRTNGLTLILDIKASYSKRKKKAQWSTVTAQSVVLTSSMYGTVYPTLFIIPYL